MCSYQREEFQLEKQGFKQSDEFYIEGGFPSRGQRGFQLKVRYSKQNDGIPNREIGSNWRDVFQLEGVVPTRGGFNQREGFKLEGVPTRGRGSNQREGFQLDGGAPTRGKGSNQREGFQLVIIQFQLNRWVPMTWWGFQSRGMGVNQM